jgi:hypothetical protein
MIQLILTYIIISMSVFYVLFKVYDFFFIKKASCQCGSGSCGIKAEILKNMKNKPSLSQLKKI